MEKVEIENKKRFEFDKKLLEERAHQLEEELNENIEKGDNQYEQLKEEIKYQDETEQNLSLNLNDLGNKNNILLRSKLNQNKSDFERLRHLGSTNGALGTELEIRVAKADQMKQEILSIRRDAHTDLIDIRDMMKCDIGMDQKPY